MPATIIVGAQWGDEGKGRVADWLASQSDVVARYAGGDNAGHTVSVGDAVYKLHLIPSGILHERAVCVLGNGTVINPVNLVREMEELRAHGIAITPDRLVVSTRAHIITPAHIALDKAQERARGAEAIGTTLRGIGPAYLDKTGRRGIRAGEMRDPEAFADALHAHIGQANAQIAALGGEPLDAEASAVAYLEAAETLRPYLRDTAHYLHGRLAEGAEVLCEGAQGALLDLDHGDYPYVTSSSPTAGGALTGLGFGPMHVQRVVGVAKCYATRVGSGPMPTEIEGPLLQRLRGTGANFWDEFGATTGRPRRCGWLDLMLLRYTSAVNGFSHLVLTKLDILSGIGPVQVATGYRLDGRVLDAPPSTAAELARAEPVYETLAGWDEDVSGARTPADLPASARAYVEQIAAWAGVKLMAVSVGPERDQIIFF
jgi:adenylosuccinate synthase